MAWKSPEKQKMASVMKQEEHLNKGREKRKMNMRKEGNL